MTLLVRVTIPEKNYQLDIPSTKNVKSSDVEPTKQTNMQKINHHPTILHSVLWHTLH